MSNARTEAAAIERGEPHNQPGQLNIYVLDVDSHVTSYGRHNRLTASVGTGDDSGKVYVDEHVTDLPRATMADLRAAIRRDWPGSARLSHVSSEPWESRLGPKVEHIFTR